MGQNKKGYEYEDFVFKCFNAIHAWVNNCPDLKNSFKIEKGVKLPTYSGTTTNQIDIYIEYTQPGGLVVKTAVECKKRKTIEIDQIRDFNDKLRKIKNINGIFAYSGHLQQGVIDYAKEEDIKLWNIEALIKEIELTIRALTNYHLINIEFEQDKNWSKINDIENGEYNFSYKGIKINNEEHIFCGENDGKFLNWLSANRFKKNIIEVGKTISYSRNEENDRLYIIFDCENDDVLNNLHKLKIKKLELTFAIINYPTFKTNIKIDNDDSFAQIEDIITGKKQIVFESGKIQ